MAAAIAWQMRGEVMEACSCATTCPCNFGSDPTEAPCGAIVAWRIGEGRYGETGLDGLNAVLYLRHPGHLFAGGWTVGFYLDERADPPQREALGAIFSGQAGGGPAAVVGLVAHPLPPKYVPVRFETADGDVRVTVPGLLEVGTERVPNPMPGQPPLEPEVNGLVVPFYTGPASVRQSTTLKLTDPQMSFEYAGRSSLVGQFEYRGP